MDVLEIYERTSTVHCPCVERMDVFVCAQQKSRCVLALFACVTFHSWLAACFNYSYFPDGTLGNDNLWAIQSNYISFVGTYKKTSIINNK